MPSQGLRALEPRHCAWSTTFKKVDETIAKVSANNTKPTLKGGLVLIYTVNILKRILGDNVGYILAP